MKLSVTKDGNIQVKNIYNPIVLVAERETIVLCERDGVFEIQGIQGRPTTGEADLVVRVDNHVAASIEVDIPDGAKPEPPSRPTPAARDAAEPRP